MTLFSCTNTRQNGCSSSDYFTFQALVFELHRLGTRSSQCAAKQYSHHKPSTWGLSTCGKKLAKTSNSQWLARSSLYACVVAMLFLRPSCARKILRSSFHLKSFYLSTLASFPCRHFFYFALHQLPLQHLFLRLCSSVSAASHFPCSAFRHL